MKCAQCGRPLCPDCRSKKGRCGSCESYNLPGNFLVLPETAHGFRSQTQIWLNSHTLADIPKPHVFWYDDPKLRRSVTVKCRMWAGIGVHYHTNLEEDEDPLWCSEEKAWVKVRDHHEERPAWNPMTCRPKTVEEAAAWIRRQLVRHYGKRPTFVVFKSCEIARWFYREGD